MALKMAMFLRSSAVVYVADCLPLRWLIATESNLVIAEGEGWEVCQRAGTGIRRVRRRATANEAPLRKPMRPGNGGTCAAPCEDPGGAGGLTDFDKSPRT